MTRVLTGIQSSGKPHLGNILGAINLIKNTKAIDDAVFEVRLGILKVFGIALCVTVLLSIY